MSSEGYELIVRASQIFQPASPVKTKELFAGRLRQIAKVAEAVSQDGSHVAIYGERGVGKTSLANVLSDLGLFGMTETVRVTCDITDSFGSAWSKVAVRLAPKQEVGFPQLIRGEGAWLDATATPDEVLRFLSALGRPTVCIFDEFDRMVRTEARIFSDLIKALSDHAVPSTVILVGVAETVTDLVEDHASVERALVQVNMPRMQDAELEEILTKAAKQLGVTFTDNAKKAIVGLSQGLPHYTHLLGRESVRAVVEMNEGHRSVGVQSVRAGIKTAIEGAQETIREQYSRAVRSARNDALYKEVLLACAVTKKGDRSSFRAGDVSRTMTKMMGKPYDIPAISKHLKAFCDDMARAQVLTRSGKERNFLYRFRNPLMESFVLMRGVQDDLISPDLGTSSTSGT